MSTLNPSSAASSLTDLVSVTSSGTSVTFGSSAIAGQPGGFFQGSQWPAQTRSAPASSTAFTTAWPTGDLASVTSTLRNLGSDVKLRSFGSSASAVSPLAGLATSA